MSVEFCDTNVLVYAYYPQEGPKHDRAAEVLDRLWQSGDGAISIQVLQEFFVVSTRKLRVPTTFEEARARVQSLTSWRLFAPGAGDVLDAIDASVRNRCVAISRHGTAARWSDDACRLWLESASSESYSYL